MLLPLEEDRKIEGSFLDTYFYVSPLGVLSSNITLIINKMTWQNKTKTKKQTLCILVPDSQSVSKWKQSGIFPRWQEPDKD